MADVATLGIAVDSRQVKSAEQDLSRFESAAKRAGVSVQEMQRRAQATSERMTALRARTQAASQQLATYATQTNAASVATQRLSVASGAATAAITRLAGSLVAGFAGAQGYLAIRRAVDEVARIGETAERVGVSARELQVLRHAIDMAGGEASQADRALENFARKLAEAGNNAGDLFKVFQANGRVISGTVSRDFRTFLDLLSRTRNEQDRLAIAQKIFGADVGRQVVSALSKGSAALDEYARQAERVGILTDEQIKKARDLDKQFTEFERGASTSLKTIAVDIAPALLSVLQAISRVVKSLTYDFSLLQQGNFKDVIGLYTSVTERDAAMRRRQFTTGEMMGQLTQKGADAFYGAFGSTFGGAARTGGRDTVNPFGGRSTSNDYDRATKAITRRIQALEIEARTFNMTEREAARYRATQELVNAAQMAGIRITPQMSKDIEALAGRYAQVTEQLERLRDRQETIDFLKDSTKSFLNDFSSALRDGASAWDAFREAGANALERISQKLIDMAVNDLFSKAFGGNQGFGFGSLMNFLGGGGSGASGGYWQGGTWVPKFHDGGVVGQTGGARAYVHPAYFDDAPRYHSGGIAGLKPNEVPAILERGERIIPNGVGMTVSPVFNVQADPGQDPMRAIRAYVNSPAFEADWIRQSKKARDGRKA